MKVETLIDHQVIYCNVNELHNKFLDESIKYHHDDIYNYIIIFKIIIIRVITKIKNKKQKKRIFT